MQFGKKRIAWKNRIETARTAEGAAIAAAYTRMDELKEERWTEVVAKLAYDCAEVGKSRVAKLLATAIGLTDSDCDMDDERFADWIRTFRGRELTRAVKEVRKIDFQEAPNCIQEFLQRSRNLYSDAVQKLQGTQDVMFAFQCGLSQIALAYAHTFEEGKLMEWTSRAISVPEATASMAASLVALAHVDRGRLEKLGDLVEAQRNLAERAFVKAKQGENAYEELTAALIIRQMVIIRRAPAEEVTETEEFEVKRREEIQEDVDGRAAFFYATEVETSEEEVDEDEDDDIVDEWADEDDRVTKMLERLRELQRRFKS